MHWPEPIMLPHLSRQLCSWSQKVLPTLSQWCCHVEKRIYSYSKINIDLKQNSVVDTSLIFHRDDDHHHHSPHFWGRVSWKKKKKMKKKNIIIIIIIIISCRGSIAKRLESWTCNLKAASSSPALTFSWICSWQAQGQILGHTCK